MFVSLLGQSDLTRPLNSADLDLYNVPSEAFGTFKTEIEYVTPEKYHEIDINSGHSGAPSPEFVQSETPIGLQHPNNIKNKGKKGRGGPKSAEERQMMNKNQYGPPILPAIAEVVQTVCTTTANVYQIVECYNIPENCPYLRPPAIQHDIFKTINAQQRSYDNFMQSIYMQLGIAMVPLIQSCTFFEKSITIDNEIVYQLLKDSMLLLCNLFLEISIKRRRNIRVHLPKHQRWLCVRKMTIGSYFFPEELLKSEMEPKYLKQEFDKTHRSDDEEKHIYAQQLLNKKRIDDSMTDVPTWEMLAELVNLACTIPVNLQELKKIRQKYPIPENCQCLRPPLCNESVWNQMSNLAVNDDRALQNIQRLIGHAVVPVLSLLESIKFINVQPFDMFSMQKEALYILCTTLRDISTTRRRYLKEALPGPLKVRCACWIPIGRVLCGDGTESKISKYRTGKPISYSTENNTTDVFAHFRLIL